MLTSGMPSNNALTNVPQEETIKGIIDASKDMIKIKHKKQQKKNFKLLWE